LVNIINIPPVKTAIASPTANTVIQSIPSMLLHSLTQGSDGYPLKAGQIRRDKKELRSFLSRFAVVAGVTRETTSNVGTILQRRALPLTTELGKDSGLNSPLLQSTVGTFTARNSWSRAAAIKASPGNNSC
jgi:hypothetical protein